MNQEVIQQVKQLEQKNFHFWNPDSHPTAFQAGLFHLIRVCYLCLKGSKQSHSESSVISGPTLLFYGK